MPIIVGTGISIPDTGFLSAFPSTTPVDPTQPSSVYETYVSPNIDPFALSAAQKEVERRKQAETNAIRQAVERIAAGLDIDYTFTLPEFQYQFLGDYSAAADAAAQASSCPC